MRRILLLFAVALIGVAACFGQPTDVDIVYSGMIPRVIVWEPPTEDINNQPVGGLVQYEIFICLQSDHSDAESVLLTTEPAGTVDVSARSAGYYYVGVRAATQDAEGELLWSTVAWSNTTVATDPTPRFAWLVVRAPKPPTVLQTLL